MFHTIDTHTGGRLPVQWWVASRLSPEKLCRTKWYIMMERQDWIRRVLTLEPRGNEVMCSI